MNYLKMFQSRTVWVIILMFVVNGVSGIREVIPANALPIIDALLTLAAIYFRVKPKQNFSE